MADHYVPLSTIALERRRATDGGSSDASTADR